MKKAVSLFALSLAVGCGGTGGFSSNENAPALTAEAQLSPREVCYRVKAGDLFRAQYKLEVANSNALLDTYVGCKDEPVCVSRTTGALIREYYGIKTAGDYANQLSSAYDRCGGKDECVRKASGDMIRSYFGIEVAGEEADDLRAAYDQCAGREDCVSKSTGDMIRVLFSRNITGSQAEALLKSYDLCSSPR